MNKKGFTLIELTLVLALLLLLSGLIIPNLTSVDKDTKNDLYEGKISLVLDEAYQYGMENIDLLSSECTLITVGELIELNYVVGDDENKENLIDPRDNTSMNDISICIFYKDGKVLTEVK